MCSRIPRRRLFDEIKRKKKKKTENEEKEEKKERKKGEREQRKKQFLANGEAQNPKTGRSISGLPRKSFRFLTGTDSVSPVTMRD